VIADSSSGRRTVADDRELQPELQPLGDHQGPRVSATGQGGSPKLRASSLAPGQLHRVLASDVAVTTNGGPSLGPWRVSSRQPPPGPLVCNTFSVDPAVTAAVIAAAAALAVAGIGIWQWRRSGANDQRNAYREQRVAVLKQLWENIQNLEAESRINRVTATGFATQKQALNNFLHLNAPLLKTDEQMWAGDCVQSLENIEEILAAQPVLSPDNEAWSATMDELPAFSEVMTAYGVYVTNRDHLKNRYRDALQGRYV
jgi:hypothetical protein